MALRYNFFVPQKSLSDLAHHFLKLQAGVQYEAINNHQKNKIFFEVI